MADREFEIPACALQAIAEAGYRADTSMAQHIDAWRSWYTGNNAWYDEAYVGVDGRKHTRRKLSLRPARRVCREWASLIADEMRAASDSPKANEWIQGWCEDTGLYALFQSGIERAFADGTGAMSLWFDAREDGMAIRVRRYDARMAVPLSWDDDGVTECAFCTRAFSKGKPVTQLQMHVLEEGTYRIRTRLWLESQEVFDDGILADFDTKSPYPTFCVFSPAIDNTLVDSSPFGMSVFHDAVGAIKLLDAAWTALYDEVDLLRAVLMVPDSMIEVASDGAGGTRAVPFGEREQRLYRLTESAVDSDGKPYAFVPQMRIQPIYEAYRTAVAALGDECGFGSQYFVPDRQGGLKTATEVSSDNSALMRNIRKHENAIGKQLCRMLDALAECSRIWCGAPVEEGFGRMRIVWDDSIISDTDAEKQRMLAEVSAGVVPKWMYLSRFYGMSEEEARAELPEAAVLDAGF